MAKKCLSPRRLCLRKNIQYLSAVWSFTCQEGHPTIRPSLQVKGKKVATVLHIRIEYPGVPTQGDRSAGKSITIRIATLNVNGIRGRSNDILYWRNVSPYQKVDVGKMLVYQRVDICYGNKMERRICLENPGWTLLLQIRLKGW